MVEWPATKMLMDKTGVKDSFREVYPDELEHPGTFTFLCRRLRYLFCYDILDRPHRTLRHGDGTLKAGTGV